MLRFTEKNTSARDDSFYVLPGLTKINSTFDSMSRPAYCDHWVSNVYSRTDFWNTLGDVLGFTCKVREQEQSRTSIPIRPYTPTDLVTLQADFNAGVVAAGEAQIESTVIGNSSPFETSDTSEALTDQSQVYLPINNALSEVG